MPDDVRRLGEAAIVRASRLARHLPGMPGGMGIYFSAQDRLSSSPGDQAWPRDVDALLTRADRALAAGRVKAGLRWFDKALRISYHPALHNAGRSPLVTDPQRFLRPLRASRTGAILLDGEIPPGSAPKRPAPRHAEVGEPIRLLVIAQENWTFIRPILDGLRASGDFEIREIEANELPASEAPDRDEILRGRYDLVTTGTRLPTPPRIAEAYEWADVALVEWGHHILTWVTLLDRAPRFLVARYHRFEAFTPFPLLHDHTQVDRMLHVSPPVHNLLETIAPTVTETQYVANMLSRGLGDLPEGPRDTHVLVQVGWIREIKDVLFSLDVLERLRRHDDRFRLQLVGPGLPRTPSHDTAYQRRVRRRLDDLGPQAVDVLGRREDVPAIFGGAGFVLSSSYHEGTHESVMEGLAAGCPAVIRDWPDAAAFGGAATLYREDWVVPDVDGAVARILQVQEPDRYREESSAAREWAVAHRDPAVVTAGFEKALRP